MATYKKKKIDENPTNASLASVRKDISEGAFSRVYLLYGEESYLINQMRDELIDALGVRGNEEGFQKFSGDKININEVIDFITTFPFLTEHRVAVVQGSGLFKTSNDIITEMASRIPDSNVLILCETAVEKNRIAFQHLNKSEYAKCLEYRLPNMEDIRKWVSVLLSRDNLKVKLTVPDRFLDTLGKDLNMYLIENEANKLHDYCMSKGTVLDEDVDLICANSIEDKIFKMCSLISQRKSAEALMMYNDLLKLKVTPVSVIVLITRQYNLLAQTKQLLQDGANISEVMSKLKVRDFAARELAKIAGSYNMAELLTALDRCHQALNDVMSGALSGPNSAENLMITLVR